MTSEVFHVEVSVDEATGRLIAAYFQVRLGEVARTKEIEPGVVMADYDAQGVLLGVEILGSCSAEVFDAIAENEPAPIKRFFRQSMPTGLLEPIGA